MHIVARNYMNTMLDVYKRCMNIIKIQINSKLMIKSNIYVFLLKLTDVYISYELLIVDFQFYLWYIKIKYTICVSIF